MIPLQSFCWLLIITSEEQVFNRAAELGCSKAHSHLADVYHQGGDLKKTRFHFEAAAMAGNEFARCIVGVMQSQSGNMERAVKHWAIAASAGQYKAMHHLRILFGKGFVSRESIDSTLISYNNSCAEMRSDGRDAAIRAIIKRRMPRT
jgi:TPR repeat protein